MRNVFGDAEKALLELRPDLAVEPHFAVAATTGLDGTVELHRPSRLTAACATLGAMAASASEALKSSVKRRAAERRTVELVVARTEATAHWNGRYETVVFLIDRRVFKVYLESIAQHRVICELVAPLMSASVHVSPRSVICEQPRFGSMRPDLSIEELFVAVEPTLAGLRERARAIRTGREIFCVTGRVAALAYLLWGGKCPATSVYQSIARKLESLAEAIGVEMCHGDLWRENIMQDAHCRPQLIDFDKCIEFLPVYDRIYLFLMDVMRSERVGLKVIAEQARSLSSRFDRLDRLGRESIQDSESRARAQVLCIGLFCLLKGIESDHAIGRPGRCADALGTLVGDWASTN